MRTNSLPSFCRIRHRYDPSKSFVLVHGVTQGPTGWDRLRQVLETVGHETLVVDLRLEDLADADGVACAQVIAETANLPVHLVGTSGSGVLIPLVPTLVPVEELVFICGALPDIGRSLVDQIDHDGVLTDEWMADPGPSTEAAARRFMFNDCDYATARWGLTTVRIFNPPRVYEEVNPPRAMARGSGHLHRRDARPHHPAGVVKTSRARTPRCDAYRDRSGHCPQVSMPERLAELMDV
jgi:hypothetical protein